MPDEDKSLDVFGLKPGAKAVQVVVEGTVQGASAFLSRICLPAAEEFGLLLQDKVRAWRADNALKIVARAAKKFEATGHGEQDHAPPRLVGAILENGSWEDDETVQDMWAGLLASSCTTGGNDQSNLIFVNLLTSITGRQARFIAYICNNAPKYLTPLGLLVPMDYTIEISELEKLFETKDIHSIDIQLDHLREVGLLTPYGGFDPEGTREASVVPSALSLHLYARSQGVIGSPAKFYGLDENAPQHAAPEAG